MAFHSILFESESDGPPVGDVAEPDFFVDLQLDQVIAEITRGYAEYDLVPFFRTELTRECAVQYRHDVMRDIEQASVFECIQTFASTMRRMRECLEHSRKVYYPKQKQWWFVEAAAHYSQAVEALSTGLVEAEPQSKGLRQFVSILNDYLGSETYRCLTHDIDDVGKAMATVQYCIHIKGSVVTVTNFGGEIDYSHHVLRIFERFKQGEVKDHSVPIREWSEMNHVEAQILDCASELNTEPFRLLQMFCERHEQFLSELISKFDREIEFYIAYRSHIKFLEGVGLKFCYPRVSAVSKRIRCVDTFDIALAHKLRLDSTPVVCNDFELDGLERIFVVSGPNNGGKTTFARTFGQLHYLAKLGCPVPGREAFLYLYDQLFAHFEREENTKDLRGKLQDDLIRIHDILQRSGGRSIILMNEIFSSTTLADALLLSRQIIAEIMDRDTLAVCVTFIDELSRLGPKTVSMVSEISTNDPASRTFKVRRRAADGRAYALSVAERYGLTREKLKERIAS